MPDDQVKTEHYFHAEATVLEGHLKLPLEHKIERQAHANLPAHGGYLSQHAEDYKLEGVISFDRAYTQVGGNDGDKEGQRWVTLVTSVIEGFNVLDVLTCDRIVAQMSLAHPPAGGYIPTVSFLGTRFENLQIAGHEINVPLNLEMVGQRIDEKTAYTSSTDFLDRVAGQNKAVLQHPNLPPEWMGRYTGVSRGPGDLEAVECSLIDQIGQTESTFPGSCHGHVIHVPDFGTISLANLCVEHSDIKPGTTIPRKTKFNLRMVDMKLGCSVSGNLTSNTSSGNGITMP